MPRWFQISFSPDQRHDVPDMLLGLGAAGVEQRPNSLVCYLQATESELEDFIGAVKHLALTVISHAPVEEKNWVQEAEKTWPRLEIGRLCIVPILDADRETPPPPKENEILILPGTGFGTGHHQTTRLALLLAQDKRVEALAPKRILDLGTGSGILALGCRKLFPATIVASDIDEMSLENAQVNLRLNHSGPEINLIKGSIEASGAGFDLILANIYAEVLVSLEPGIRAAIKPNGLLIVSGILQKLFPELRQTYQKNWEFLEVLEDGEWVAGLLARKLS